MKRVKLLLVEGTYAHKQTSFALSLRRHFDVMTATTGKQALRLADMIRPDIIILNAASMRTSGDRICTSLSQVMPTVPIIHIMDQEASKADRDKSSADIVMRMPFTVRKLMNRVQRFVEADDGELLKAGHLALNLKTHMLETPAGEQSLTPKVASLLELFIRHEGSVIKREDLIKKVWETDYMGDTRTLDVHIRWLREAVETNPSKPRHIVTVRGVGYKYLADGKDRKK